MLHVHALGFYWPTLLVNREECPPFVDGTRLADGICSASKKVHYFSAYVYVQVMSVFPEF